MDVSGTEKTILVGALGAGGAGLYALDVTTPTATSETDAASKVLWEITATGDFANLGHTYGTPVFTKLSGGTAAVIVGNGYMNTGNGHAVLYIINANTGALINAIDTGSGSLASPNGLSTPTLYDTDGDFRPEYAYAGDIDGNLWKFDLTNNTSSLLFTTSPVQAITTAPAARSHPNGGQMVAFATGRILTSGDEIDTSVHYVYGIWDGAPDANNQLLVQALTTSTFDGGGVRTISDNAPDWTAGSGHHMGWKFSLPPGERVVGEMPFYNNGRFYFLASNPTIGTGESWLHEVVFHTGGSPLSPIYDLNEDGLFNDADLRST
jgi:type IV pilus assembly protein PilY1